MHEDLECRIAFERVAQHAAALKKAAQKPGMHAAVEQARAKDLAEVDRILDRWLDANSTVKVS